MNLGWIRELFTLSELEKERIKEPAPDPRQIQPFRELESLITDSLTLEQKPAVQNGMTTTRILTESAQPKFTATRTAARSMPDQELLKKLLKHRPNYTSNRILRPEILVTKPQDDTGEGHTQ